MDTGLISPNEKILGSRKPSILSENAFWGGIISIALSTSIFGFLSVLYPTYDFSLKSILNFFKIAGIGFFGDIPLVPAFLLVIGLLYIVYAEFAVYFKEFIVTNERIIVKRGIISKDANSVLPDKIADVSVDISVIDRVLGLGKIVLRPQESSRPQITLEGIRDPYKFQDEIMHMISKETYKNVDHSVNDGDKSLDGNVKSP